MTDITFAMEAKSDQLNAADIIGADRVIRIRDVIVKKTDQPITIYFDDDNNRPWKPCKGMIRIIAECWGVKSEEWIGKSIKIFRNPDVIYGGEKVGGIQIRAIEGLEKPTAFTVALNRKKRIKLTISPLSVIASEYPQDKFEQAFPAMQSAMQAGKMTLQQVIAQCQKTGQLNPEQIAALENAAPKED